MAAAPGGKNKYSDPLAWWKTHQHMFPHLAELAKLFLGIQATSAPTERVFSQASLILREKRNRLDPKLAGALILVKRNWQWFKSEVQLAQLAAATADGGPDPGNVPAFAAAPPNAAN